MSATVIFGGQIGSEGKGKFAGYLARKDNFDAAINNFYSNAGHTWVDNDGKPYMVQHLPQAMVNKSTKLFIGPGAGITIPILQDEIEKFKEFGVADRLKIHPRAMIIQQKHKDEEGRRLGHISSTQKGCGAAQADKIMRDSDVKLVRDFDCLRPYLADTAKILNDMLDHNRSVMIEGSQGFDLDINYGIQYPYTTSRQTTVGQVIADCGIPFQEISSVIAVIRCHPIRVGNQFDNAGNQVGWSGPAGGKELTWDQVTTQCGSPVPLQEKTTVTQKVRRIFEMDWDRLSYMAMINRPTEIALNFVNYIDYSNFGVTQYGSLTQRTKDFIKKVEYYSGAPVTLIGTGPRDCDIVDIRKYKVVHS